MKRMIFVLAFLFSGCTDPMSFEEVQKAESYCASKGMTSKRDSYAGDKFVRWIKCVDNKGNEFTPKEPTNAR